ncbi:MAG TPA: choice-of-anchor tandem repeat GloVer-containing protein, partial [Verrucomicrobiae bacterium]|nr:choice-of-anchor tandem repeat GloVer-containing protein [Verrucomicrobiae bacterium]
VNGNLDGAVPVAGLILSGDTFYGTTGAGGSGGNGTVFAINTNGSNFRVLYNFSPFVNGLNGDGASPNASLLLSGGTLYGTADLGGSHGGGTVFSLSTNGTGFKVLHTFAGGILTGSSDGANPLAGVILAGNTLYGTTQHGGTYQFGAVFAVNTDGTGFQSLYSFTTAFYTLNTYDPNGYSTNNDGAYPQSPLLLVGDTLYGTAAHGGTNGYGTLFSLNTNGTGFVTRHNFLGGDGGWPVCGLILAGNKFFGTTFAGGADGGGTVFAINTNGSRITSLHNFSLSDGGNVVGGLILSSNVLYGTTVAEIFAVKTNGTGYTVLDGLGGVNPFLVLLGNSLYSTSEFGGDAGQGTVFRLTLTSALEITAPTGGQVVSAATFNVTGTTSNSLLTTVTNVYVQLNNGAWVNATTANGWSNWTANVTLTAGSNTVSAYAVDNLGNPSVTNVVTFDKATSGPPSADLSLGVTAPSGPMQASVSVTYSIAVTNLGPSTATSVVISNRLAANEIFFSATSGGTNNSGVFLANLGSLPPGAGTNISLIVYPTLLPAQVAGHITNQFQVFATEADPVSANNSVTLVNVINRGIPGTPLTIFGADFGAVIVTSAFVYNSGPITGGALEVFTNLTDIPGDVVLLKDPDGGNDPTNWAAVARFFNPADPTGTNNLAATDSQAFFANNYNGAGFAGFQLFPNTSFQPASSVISVSNSFEITSTYTVFGPSGAIIPGQSALNVLTLINYYPDLILTASAAPEPVAVGDNLVYSLNVSNNPDTSFEIDRVATAVISNRIPAGVTFVSATGGATPANGVLLMNLGPVAEGTNISVQVVVHPTTAGKITNSFQVLASEFEPNLTNNSATLVSTVTNVPAVVGIPGTPRQLGTDQTLFIAEFVGSTTETFQAAYAGDTLNGAPSNAIPGDVVMLLTTNGTHSSTNWAAVARFFNPADPTGINGSPATQARAFFPTNAGGAGFAGFQLFPNVAYLAGTTNSPASGYVSAIYLEIGPAGGLASGQTDTTDLIVSNPVADLQLSVTESPNPVDIATSNLLTYTFTVTNAGPATTTDVTVSNQLFTAGSPYTFNTATGGSQPTNGILLMNLGTLAAGATTTAQLTVHLDRNGDTPTLLYTNLFRVYADQADPVPADNLATAVFVGTNTSLTLFTTSTRTFTANLTATVKQQATNFSTELIAVMPGTGVVYDQTFAVPFTDPSVQTAVTVAAGDLTTAGATSYIGPGQKSLTKTFQNQSSVLSTNPVATNIVTTVTQYVGPKTINVGAEQSQTLVLASGQTDVDTLVAAYFTNLVTTTVTSNFLTTTVYAMTGTVAQVDVALTLSGNPNPVSVGDPLTYSLTVTNKSSVTATAVVVSNMLPAGVTFNSALPSQGSATNQLGIVTYAIGSLAHGSSATLAIVVVPNAAGLLTNTARAFSTQTDSQPANNAVTNITTAVNGAITNLALTVLSDITLNSLTGLYEQRIQVSNGGPATPSSVRVLISGLPANDKLYNATGTTNGIPYVQSSSPLGVGSNIVFLLEYYVPNRVTPANLTLTVQAGPVVIPPVVTGTISRIDRTTVRNDGSVVVEFSAIPGQIYAVQYSSDMVTWRTAVPAITAPTSRVQWIDAGPPKTDSPPSSQPARYYRVVLLPTH